MKTPTQLEARGYRGWRSSHSTLSKLVQSIGLEVRQESPELSIILKDGERIGEIAGKDEKLGAVIKYDDGVIAD